MSDLDFILVKLKQTRFKPWNEQDLEECKVKLNALTKEELRVVRHSRWMDESNSLYQPLFDLLYREELGDILEKLSQSSSEELIALYKERKSKVKKEYILSILLQRFDVSEGEQKEQIKKILLKNKLL